MSTNVASPASMTCQALIFAAGMVWNSATMMLELLDRNVAVPELVVTSILTRPIRP